MQVSPLPHDLDARLREYAQAKQQVAACIRSLKQHVQALGDEERLAQCQELLLRLAADRFNLAVVGQFKRGKSSLMNALIGRSLLPTGILPMTSAITALCYGPRERVLLHRQGWAIEQEIALEQLSEFITEHANPGNRDRILEARIEVPASVLRRGLYLVDTPGIGSSQRENTETTLAFLPQADAVIVVTSVEAPLSEAEEAFLREIRAEVRHTLVVVNKIDLLTASERETLLAYVQPRIAQALENDAVAIFPLSARLGLEAKLRSDPDALQASGLGVFEESLTTLLVEAQGRLLLASLLDRALRLLPDGGATAGEVAEGESPEQLRERMETLRRNLLAGMPLALVGRDPQPQPRDERIIEATIAKSRAKGQRALSPLPHTSTCSICATMQQAVFTFFTQWQYALATDEAAQRAFAAEHGFCAGHTWQFQQLASPQGISTGFAALVEATAAALRQAVGAPSEAARSVAGLIAHQQTCTACRVQREAETGQIRQLLDLLTSQDGRERYASSEGICLPHLAVALAAPSGDPGVSDVLMRQAIGRLEEIAEDMRSYALKRDALGRHLAHEQEEQAWKRALVHLVGERGMVS